MATCEACGKQGWPPEFLNEVFGELPGCPACEDWAAMTSPERRPRTDHSRVDVAGDVEAPATH